MAMEKNGEFRGTGKSFGRKNEARYYCVGEARLFSHSKYANDQKRNKPVRVRPEHRDFYNIEE